MVDQQRSTDRQSGRQGMPLLRKVRRCDIENARASAARARGHTPDWCPSACPRPQASEVGKHRSPAGLTGPAGQRGTSKGAGDARRAPSPLPPAASPAQPGAAGSGNAFADDYVVVRMFCTPEGSNASGATSVSGVLSSRPMQFRPHLCPTLSTLCSLCASLCAQPTSWC